mgnify:CR=1 FL=1
MLAATVYIFITIQSKNYLLLHLFYAICLCCLSILSSAAMALIMFEKDDRTVIGVGYWIELFTRSQIISNFIPGVGVLYRAQVLKKSTGISIKRSTISLLRTLMFTFSLLLITCIAMYWSHFLEYRIILGLFVAFIPIGIVIFLLSNWFFISATQEMLSENQENIADHTLNDFKLSLGNLILFIFHYVFSTATISAAYFYLVSGAQGQLISIFDSLNIFVAMKFLSFSPSFIPSNFGLQEFLLIGINQLANVGIEDIIIFSLMIRIMHLISNLILIIIYRTAATLFSTNQRKFN